jgi:PEP-CTERM motif
MKRSFFLTLAAGLLASLAFAAPSQAGTIVTTTLEFVGPLSPAATSITFDYTLSAGSISDLGGLASSAPGTTFGGSTANSVTLDFSPGVTNLAIAKFTFVDNAVAFADAPTSITLTSVTAAPGGQTITTSAALAFFPSVVPEPTSIALLGIGMTGFLAFRRLFKRTSVA